MKYCPFCGKKLPTENLDYCPFCGKKLSLKKKSKISLDNIKEPLLVILVLVILLFILWNPISEFVNHEILGAPTDCGSDLQCFKSKAVLCSPAKMDFKYDVLGAPLVAKLRIIGIDNGKCVFKADIEKTPPMFASFQGREIICRLTGQEDFKNLSPNTCVGIDSSEIKLFAQLFTEVLSSNITSSGV